MSYLKEKYKNMTNANKIIGNIITPFYISNADFYIVLTI